MTDEIEEENEQDTQKGKYLTFLVSEEMYAVEIRIVREIISILPITPVPEYPCYIKGIINLRGEIIPVMDLRLRFKKEEQNYDFKTSIVIIDVEGVPVGLIVDSVSEVSYLEDNKITMTPDIKNRTDGNYVKEIGIVEDGIWLILDCDRLFQNDDLNISVPVLKR